MFATTIDRYDSEIQAIDQEIERLRQLKSEKEQERQALLSVKQMWESAIAQLETAKAATKAIGMDGLLAEAQAAANAVFLDIEFFPAEPEPTEKPEPEPKLLPSEPPTITIEAEVIESNGHTNGNGNGHGKVDYSKLTWVELRRTAIKKGLKTKGKNRQQIEDELTKLTTN